MSKLMVLIAAGLAAALAIAGCETTTPEQRGMKLMEEGYEKVPAGEVQRTFTDATITDTDGEWVVYVAADGSQKFKSLKGSFRDSGQSEVENGRWCSEWEKLRRGARQCFDTYRKGDVYTQVKDDGSLGQSFTVEPGNTKGL